VKEKYMDILNFKKSITLSEMAYNLSYMTLTGQEDAKK